MGSTKTCMLGVFLYPVTVAPATMSLNDCHADTCPACMGHAHHGVETYRLKHIQLLSLQVDHQSSGWPVAVLNEASCPSLSHCQSLMPGRHPVCCLQLWDADLGELEQLKADLSTAFAAYNERCNRVSQHTCCQSRDIKLSKVGLTTRLLWPC